MYMSDEVVFFRGILAISSPSCKENKRKQKLAYDAVIFPSIILAQS
jgi:hypothetical protein